MHSLAVFLSLVSVCLAKTINFDWTVEFVDAAPDNFTRQVIGINKAWPCPTIEGNVGDRVVIKLTNNLGTQSTGLHFHGLNQVGTQFMDGPTGVTQCPIPPGSVFTYDFIVCFHNRVLKHASNLVLAGCPWNVLVSLPQYGTVPRRTPRYDSRDQTSECLNIDFYSSHHHS